MLRGAGLPQEVKREIPHQTLYPPGSGPADETSVPKCCLPCSAKSPKS